MSSKNQKLKQRKKVIQNQSNWIFLLIPVVGFILYYNTLNHGFVLDDPMITTQNKFVNEGLNGIKDIFNHGYPYGFNKVNGVTYRPLVLTNLAFETTIWGSNPKAYHFFNILFYILTGIVIYLFLLKLFPEENIWLPLSITLLFMAHPIHTEVVANIKSRDEILSLLFGMSSLLLLFKYVEHYKLNHLIYSLILFFSSLLSKETGLGFLLIIPLSLYFFRKISLLNIVKITAFYIILTGIYFIIRHIVLGDYNSVEGMDKINNSMAVLLGSELFATKIMVLGKYLLLLVFPHPLSYDYSFNQIPAVGIGNWKFIIALLSYVSMIGFAIYGFVKKNIIAYGILFYLSLLLIVSNLIVIIGATMAERFIYASSFGFSLIIGYTLYKCLNKKIFIYTLGTLLFLYSIKTISRNKDWKSNYTLFESGILTAPNSARAYDHFGTYYRTEAENSSQTVSKSSNYQEAIKYYKKALKIYPQYYEAEYNMGVSYYALGLKEQAKNCYEKVLSYNPQNLSALNNMGVYCFEKAEYKKAGEYFNKILLINENNLLALSNLEAVNFNLGNYEESIAYGLRLLKIEPYNKKALSLVIRSYRVLGNNEKAKAFEEKLNQIK